MAKKPARRSQSKDGRAKAGAEIPGAACCASGDGWWDATRKAVGVDADIKKANLVQLAKIEGQVRGLMRMIEEDRYCADVMVQVAAVRASLQTVGRNLMRNHLKHCASAALQHEGEAHDAMVEELLILMLKLGK